MLWTPRNRFMWRESTYNLYSSITNTPGNNTVGTTTELLSGATVANDVYSLLITFYDNGRDGQARDTLANLRVDPAGGTAWQTVIANLSASCAGRIAGDQQGEITYQFPLFIKAGSSIGYNAQVNNATVATLKATLTVYGKPTRPELVSVGSYVTTFGATTASSSGTAATPGSTFAEGTYVQLGATTTKPHWWWQQGFCFNDSAMSSRLYFLDTAFGDATNKTNILRRQRFQSMSDESIMNQPESQGVCEVPVGANIYGRIMCNTAPPDTGYSMISYGLGG